MTPEDLSRAVREEFAYAARYVALIVQNNPQGAVSELLSRPDVDAVLTDTLDRARGTSAEAVRQAWAAGGGPQHDYLSWLVDDVDRSYEALGHLHSAIRAAHSFVPLRHFVPGTSTPGTNPSAESARERAAAVRGAVLATGSGLALRSRLTLEVAATAARTMRDIEDGTELQMAGEHVWKQWRCRHNPPDERTCHWCRALHMFIVPLHGNFPPGIPADLTGHGRLTRPPRLYHGMLQGPPRHPRCRCRVKILTQLPASPVASGSDGQGGAAAGLVTPLHTAPGRSEASRGAGASGSLLAAADIRALPEDKYQALLHFLRAATHELGQVVSRLRGVLGL